MVAIKAIPTIYNGIHFRSKLEADWARSLDGHGILWTYESESFDLDDAYYLPDFILPQLNTILEVKGVMDGASLTKITRLQQAVKPRGWIVVVVGAPAGVDLEICEACSAWQFMPDKACRRCSAGTQRPDHGPPYSPEEWKQIWRWWAEQYDRAGRRSEASVFRAEAAK
jgi:hypothetical protein